MRDPVARFLLGRSVGSRPTLRHALEGAARWFVSVGLLAPAASLELIAWGALDRSAIIAFRAWLLEHRAPATATKVLSALRGLLAELHGTDRTRSLWDRIPAVRGRRVPCGRALEPDELARLFAVAGHPVRAARDRLVLALLVGAGLRRHELVRLELASLDVRGEVGELLVVGKGDRSRRVPLSRAVMRHVTAWLEHRGEEPGPLVCSVYPCAEGAERLRVHPLSPGSVNRLLGELALRAHVRHVPTHDGRRTVASALLDAGEDLVTVQRLLGHASPTVTASYDRRAERSMRAAVERLAIPEPERPTFLDDD